MVETKRIKQTISVPFLWEEKPGIPKTDWKRLNPVMQLPVKLIASVWEEKPGTPLPLPPIVPLQQQQRNTNNPFYDSDCDCDFDQQYDQVQVQVMGITHHKNNNPFCDSSDEELELEESDLQAPSSQAWETESNASSYATTTTLAGSSFLECMFPLLTPKSSFFETLQPTCNACGTKPLTLGELILMSRRRSQAVESHQHNHSTELMMRNTYGCCIDVGGLHKLKKQLQLKLV